MRLKNSWWIQSAVELFPSCVHRSSCIILMVTAVCFQEWQSSLWGFGGGGEAALNYSIQIYTELSEIIGITYVRRSDGGRQPVL